MILFDWLHGVIRTANVRRAPGSAQTCFVRYRFLIAAPPLQNMVKRARLSSCS